MGRSQRVGEKNGLICLVMFNLAFMVIEMSQTADFLYFLLLKGKNQSQFGQSI